MIGIYLITNKINGKKYVGQSVDIMRRYSEHLRSGQPDLYSKKSERDSKTPIHLAMQKYGVNNFSLTVLEECLEQDLNEREKYWINYYQTTDKTKGYNVTDGGQDNLSLKGEQHSQAKLSQKDVDRIKYLLKNTKCTLNDILQEFPFISKPTLSMINQGKTWFSDQDQYPLRVMETAHKGSANGRAKFSEEQVVEIRTKYSQGTSPKSLYEEYGYIASQSAISAIIYGKTFKHLPIWNNSKKEWIEPCIDYSQSLK